MTRLLHVDERWAIQLNAGDEDAELNISFCPSYDDISAKLCVIRLQAQFKLISSGISIGDAISLEHWNPDQPGSLHISRFDVPDMLQGVGLARFFWHRYFHFLPSAMRGHTIVHGLITPVQSTPENTRRKEKLWADLCGHSAGHLEARFERLSGEAHVRFGGPFHDPWTPHRSRFSFSQVSASDHQ